MKVTDMLNKEIKAIEENPELMNSIPFLRDDCSRIMVACIFADGKIHYILPDRKTVFLFVKDLVGIIKENGWENAQAQFEKQKMKPLLDKGDFKI